MNNKPLVSIITIFLNTEKFITEAIESAIAQTYENWELLLVDDGSTDESTKIARYYVEQYPEKIHYLEHEHHQNQGMSATRNLGISHAQGEYVTFLDSDDLWVPHKLEQQVKILNSQSEAALVCSPARWWYGWTRKPEDINRDFIQKLDVPLNTLVKPPTLLLLFLQDEWTSLCDVLVRREVIKAVGGYEESFRGMYEDQAFHTKLCFKEAVFVAGECCYWYRQHPDACTFTSKSTEKTYKSTRQTFLNWLEKYLTKQECSNTEVWKVLQIQLFPYRYPILYQIKETVMLIARQVIPKPIRRWFKAKLPSQKYYLPILFAKVSLSSRVVDKSTSKAHSFDF